MKFNDITKKNIFQIPKGYFDHLPARIYIRLQGSSLCSLPTEKPLSEYSAINDISRKLVFTVPLHYFDTLSQRINDNIRKDNHNKELCFSAMEAFEEELMNGNTYTYNVPENYFESLPDRILARITISEEQEPLTFSALEESEAGILASIPKQNIFQVPGNYFEQRSILPVAEADMKVEGEEATTVRFIPHWTRYAMAVAASILIVLTAGYWFYPIKPTASECTELLCNLSDEEILHYLEKQDVRLSGAPNAASTRLDRNVLDQVDLSEDELLNAAESIE